MSQLTVGSRAMWQGEMGTICEIRVVPGLNSSVAIDLMLDHSRKVVTVFPRDLTYLDALGKLRDKIESLKKYSPVWEHIGIQRVPSMGLCSDQGDNHSTIKWLNAREVLYWARSIK